MKILKLSKERNDWHFWQILVVCSGSEFQRSGEALIQSIEINSPDTRVIVLITDADAEARRSLSRLGHSLLSVALYEAQIDHNVPARDVDRYRHVEMILEMTKLPSLLLKVDSLVRKDLSLLPAELQKCDCAVLLKLETENTAERVGIGSLWLSSSHAAYSFLKEVTGYLQNLDSSSVIERDEREAIYAALVRCKDFLRVAQLPEKYCDTKDDVNSYIVSDIAFRDLGSGIKQEIEALRLRFEAPVTHIVLYPKQDLGTKASLKNNQFKMRVARLSRKGRIYWRFMGRLLAELAWQKGYNARIVALPQWEITERELENYNNADVIYLPHLMRKQIDHPKARYYMQELLPSLFTVDTNGWGAASDAYDNNAFNNHVVDDRLTRFVADVKTSRTTKAPQNNLANGALPEFDVLVPLQVPGDDALIYHADITLPEFVKTLADFANRSKVKVLFRKHPYDETGFYEGMRETFSSPYAIFDSRGHIHDVLEAASAVAVINSGVGFEAMIYGKPLLSFGRAVYDLAVAKVDPHNIDEMFASLMQEDAAAREERYRKFISWYVFAVGMKVNEPTLNVEDNRVGNVAFGANPIFASLLCDEEAMVRGAKLVKIPAKQSWLRLRANISHVLRRWDRTIKRNWHRFRKSNTNGVNAKLKSFLLKDIDDSIFDGKSVALVGNASSLLRTNFGSRIDGHDIVIRMNLGYPLTVRSGTAMDDVPEKWIYSKFTDEKSTGREVLTLLHPDTPDDVALKVTGIAATGRKTDFWSCSTSDKNRQLTYASVFPCDKVACHPAYEHLSWKLLLKNKVLSLRPAIFENLSRSLELEPTSGLIWIHYLTQTKLKSLEIYGFDFFASGHIARTTPNVLQAGGKWPHDPQGERNYVFEQVLAVDPRVRLVSRAEVAETTVFPSDQ
ncbi:glycosyltransferase family 29 protein [Rhizobium sp. XQZ8]|uniref:glycosyltransferase family 29 protein n=1 Tax=Rhizobium populisoli TaxID=2859785 RepID=UPI001CA47F09|nr:glycosyltransferase family 29 protein [Rhizobium populisoli]MBW6423549.1 glycosyltransferase family 29 protein [Rhizobium populisoli]